MLSHTLKVFLLKARPTTKELSAEQIKDYLTRLAAVKSTALFEECENRIGERYSKVKVPPSVVFNKLEHQQREKICFGLMLQKKVKFSEYLKTVSYG